VDETVKLLLVDDEERNLDALETILATSGCSFVRAKSADEALLALLHIDFAAIILDIKMPGTSGLELAQLIKARKRSQHVPILFLTAYAFDEKDVIQAYDVGGVDYLTKPINPDILRSKISAFINLFRTTQALAKANDALEIQIHQRERVEEELRLAKEELESRVLERTAALDQANREIHAHADALREADRRKDEFLATLAHELRNPIAPIRYAVQVLNLKGPTTPELQWAVELIDRQTQHMARLIDDLLDVNRITRNTLELRRERVELTRIINSAIETSQPLIDRSEHQLTIHIPQKPLYVDADVVRLSQVFSNLLNNAAKYGKGAGEHGHIYLTVEETGDAVAVKIKDTGVGIAPSALPHIFEMFTQVGRSLEQSEGGLGIGLALAKRLVEMHGGTIEARSEGLRKGSEFVVTLPLLVSPSIDAASPRSSSTSRGKLKQRILIADDNPDVAEAFEFMLSMLGHEVTTAHDGIDALERAESFRPDVVILDVGMPRLNGYDVARQLRERSWTRDVVLIAITGWGSEKDKKESEDAGFNIHLVKPVDPVSLGHLLESLNGSNGSNPAGVVAGE
jgi:signal transduction histidine kinase